MGRQEKRKIRTEFRKHHESRTRKRNLTRDAGGEGFDDGAAHQERVSGKGKLTRKRTIIGDLVDDEAAGFSVQLDIDESLCQRGRVLSVFGLTSLVQAENGTPGPLLRAPIAENAEHGPTLHRCGWRSRLVSTGTRR